MEAMKIALKKIETVPADKVSISSDPTDMSEEQEQELVDIYREMESAGDTKAKAKALENFVKLVMMCGGEE